jgi:hypothetical protein
MTDAELRALVRDAVARHLGRSAEPAAPPMPLPPRAAPAHAAHPSHAMYLTLINAGDACIIEPDVECTHCGYCKTHGH